MRKNETYTGKTFQHDDLKQIVVNGAVEKSNVLVNVTVTDKGKGYNETKKTYTGVRKKNGWVRGENREFGKEYQVHVKELLNEIKEENE